MLYGKDWKKMAPLIKTRTLVQIRTHAQKVFKRMKHMGPTVEIPGSVADLETNYPCGQEIENSAVRFEQDDGVSVDIV